MWRRFGLSAVAVLFAALALAATAEADAIVVHSGSTTVRGVIDGRATVDIAGDRGFTVSAFGHSGIFGPAHISCGGAGCRPGQTVSFDAHWSGIDLTGRVTLDGVTHTVGTLNSGGAAVNFSASVVMPLAGDAAVVLTAPFLFDGLFAPLHAPQEALVGRGTLQTRLTPWRNQQNELRWLHDQTLYQFESSLAPIPEPGTIALLGVGGAMFLRRHLRRGRSR